ncbi:phage portal protein, partial [Salmonella enterica]|nr:phage portal protein [Salmonella enterica]EIK2330388.1 phage portal protein [Salmonella enterica]EKS9905183.1 phage portal protein [Salmonella enterica]
MSRKNRKTRHSGGAAEFERVLKSDPALSAFTFDGPYSVSGFDLLDNMYCADNGRWYETPVDFGGLARASR